MNTPENILATDETKTQVVAIEKYGQAFTDRGKSSIARIQDPEIAYLNTKGVKKYSSATDILSSYIDQLSLAPKSQIAVLFHNVRKTLYPELYKKAAVEKSPTTYGAGFLGIVFAKTEVIDANTYNYASEAFLFNPPKVLHPDAQALVEGDNKLSRYTVHTSVFEMYQSQVQVYFQRAMKYNDCVQELEKLLLKSAHLITPLKLNKTSYLDIATLFNHLKVPANDLQELTRWNTWSKGNNYIYPSIKDYGVSSLLSSKVLQPIAECWAILVYDTYDCRLYVPLEDVVNSGGTKKRKTTPSSSMDNASMAILKKEMAQFLGIHLYGKNSGKEPLLAYYKNGELQCVSGVDDTPHPKTAKIINEINSVIEKVRLTQNISPGKEPSNKSQYKL